MHAFAMLLHRQKARDDIERSVLRFIQPTSKKSTSRFPTYRREENIVG